MSNKVEISEIEVVNTYHLLSLGSSYVNDPKKIRKCLADIFKHFGLKLNNDSASYNTIQSRYNRILKKIKSNQSATRRDRHFGFIPDKLFYSESDFPDLCTKETSTR